MTRVFEVVGIAGSLRRGSFNRSLLRTAIELAPESLKIEVHDLAEIPLYNEDDQQAGAPDSVLRLRAAVQRADGMLIVTPEYNFGTPGVLKNAIDWLSRPALPARGNVLTGKPAAIMGASNGRVGTARSQSQLRQTLAATECPTMLKPEILVGNADEKFDAEGRLTDEVTRKYVRMHLEAFVVWLGRFQQ